jgi:inosine-uridine nucleoside N-ribohydrolase
MTEAMKRMIIDCDPGHDDAIALVLAHRHARVAGITTVSGNVPLAATTANALLLTALLGVDTPVHAGAARPLVGEPQHAPHVHGESGLGDVTRMAHDRVAASDDGVGFLLEAVAPDVWVVALGPLTNVALAIERDPGWVKRIAGISLMGGSTDVGNVTRVAEFNVYADAEAADRVFRSGADITMCGLNLTHQVMTTDAVAERLRRAGTAVSGFAAQVFDDLHGRIATLTGFREAALHDPCAVLAVTHPELIEAAPRAVSVELDGTLTRGMTVVDQRRGLRGDPATAKVGYRIDAEQALQVVMESLGVEPEPS